MKNYSRQREDLLSILKNSKSHPTAEELYNSIKEKKDKVNKRAFSEICVEEDGKAFKSVFKRGI